MIFEFSNFSFEFSKINFETQFLTNPMILVIFELNFRIFEFSNFEFHSPAIIVKVDNPLAWSSA
jgi:hypothetical protein